MFVKTRIYDRMEKLVRQPGSAGKFYSKQKGILEREVAVFLENSKPFTVPGKVFGMVVPHDPYIISGGVAARAYRQIMDQEVDYVVVVSPSHHTYFEEISLFKGDYFATPLGRAKIDRDIVWQITNNHHNLISSTLGFENDEHGIEIQLPFLQHVLYDYKLIPIVMGNQDGENIEILSKALSEVFKEKNVLMIASSNLSTSHPYEKARMIDESTITHIQDFETKKLNEDYQSGNAEMSGGGAVIAVMNACKNLGAKNAKVLLYRNSGDMGSSKTDVVGYMAALFYS